MLSIKGITVIVAAASNIGTAMIAAAMTPGAPDICAAIGAGLGTLIPVAESRKKDRSIMHLACVTVASWFAGATVPAIAVHLKAPEQFDKLSWQAWALMGFLASLVGWSAMHSIYNLGPWLSRRISGDIKRTFGGDDSDQPPGR